MGHSLHIWRLGALICSALHTQPSAREESSNRSPPLSFSLSCLWPSACMTPACTVFIGKASLNRVAVCSARLRTFFRLRMPFSVLFSSERTLFRTLFSSDYGYINQHSPRYRTTTLNHLPLPHPLSTSGLTTFESCQRSDPPRGPFLAEGLALL